jgi:hypothetical protein
MSASSSKSSKNVPVEPATIPDGSASTRETDSHASTVVSPSLNTGSQTLETGENTEENQSVTANRQQPIPPPSEPMQYRAIGLVEGKYEPSEERFNRGTILAKDGTKLDAVLLGQVMSLVKKYVDLEQDYLWVVYPRTRDKEEMLHLQVVGVWAAGGFGPIAEAIDLDPTSLSPLAPPLEDGYFSVRGQVVYQSDEKKTLFVKIQQSARKSKERAKDFKLKLNGTLPQKAIGYFWDLHIKRQGSELEVIEGTSIAPMPVKKKPFQGGKRRPPADGPYSSRPTKPQRSQRGDFGQSSSGNKTNKPVPKPVKRNNPSSSEA